MNALSKLWIGAVLTLLLLLSSYVHAATAILLNIQGAIGPATQDYIQQGFERAHSQKAQAIILQMDTPGGLSESMRKIIQEILSSPVPVIGYVAPSGARAASAGTYILYACHIAAMAPGTNLGAATPVSLNMPIGEIQKDEKEKKLSAHELKAINDARAYIRSLAQLRNRNVQWAEKAVTEAESLSAPNALQMKVIDLVAKDIPELLQNIDGRKVLIQGNEKILQTQKLTIQRIVPNWRSKFLAVITDPSVAYILLLIGFYGLFFEFANPGFVLPGVAGAICLLLALYAFQLLPVNYAGLALILLGLAFIVAEAFMPTFGALGVGGVISFVVGSILLIRTDVPGFGIPLSLILTIAITTALFFFIVLQLALRSHRRRVVSGREKMIGAMGEVVHVDGHIWVRVEGELWRVYSDEPLKVGEKVRVIEMQGLVLKVRKTPSP